MWFLVFAMLGILVLAGIVVLYVAFPHRGEDVPAVPWISDVMRKGADAVPILENTAEQAADVEQSFDLSRLGAGPHDPAHGGPADGHAQGR